MDPISDNLNTSAILEKLSLSFEERIESHENARKLVEELSHAGESLRARSQEAS